MHGHPLPQTDRTSSLSICLSEQTINKHAKKRATKMLFSCQPSLSAYLSKQANKYTKELPERI
jgi:hypothetical protein